MSNQEVPSNTFVKSIYAHEANGERVTPFGTIRFNSLGVCHIPDAELAQKVADSSPSLVMANITAEELEVTLKELKTKDAQQHQTVDDKKLGEFLATADNGATVQSESYTQQQIGNPAPLKEGEAVKEEAGAFTPTPEVAATLVKPANVIGAPADAPVELIVPPTVSKAKKGNKAPVEVTKPASSPVLAELTNDAVAAQLETFEMDEIKELMGTTETPKESYENITDKAELIKIAIDSKVIS